jgi:DNA-binding XRE family transcriptional regulator
MDGMEKLRFYSVKNQARLKAAMDQLDVGKGVTRDLIEADNGYEKTFPDAHPGKIVRGLRVKEDITQDELAKRLGIAQTRVSEIESGERPISCNMAKRLGEVFNISPKAFV